MGYADCPHLQSHLSKQVSWGSFSVFSESKSHIYQFKHFLRILLEIEGFMCLIYSWRGDSPSSWTKLSPTLVYLYSKRTRWLFSCFPVI